MFAKSERILESALAQARLIIARVRAGETLRQAAQGLHHEALPKHLAKVWSHSLVEIENGRTPVLPAIEGFASLLQLELRFHRQTKMKTQLPELQAWVLISLAVFISGISMFYFPTQLKPGFFELSLSLCLFAMGLAITRLLLKRFKKNLWLSQWAILLQSLQQQILTGHTWASALENWYQSECTQDLPTSLKTALKDMRGAVATGKTLEIKNPPHLSLMERTQLAELELLTRLINHGHPIATTLSFMSQNAKELFEQNIEREANQLSITLLAPLFACYAPAMLIILFGPLLRVIL